MPAPIVYFELAGPDAAVPRTVIPGVVTFALFRDPAGNINGLAETGSFTTPSAG